MKSLSTKKLIALRSGQVVWRVWRTVYGDDRTGYLVKAYATRYVVLGKKVHHAFRHFEDEVVQHVSIRMRCARPEPDVMSPAFKNREHRAGFLTDLHGLRAYRTQKAAQRFVDEINNGMHPEIVQDAIESHCDDIAFEDAMYEEERF